MTGDMAMQTVAERRAFIIDLCRRRQRPGSGSDLRALWKREPHMHWPNLSDVLGDLAWAVVGGVATRLYMPERATLDLDVAVAPADHREACARLAAAGWERMGDLTIGGTIWRSPEGVEVDILVCAEPWVGSAIAAAGDNRDGDGLPVLPLPYIVLLKLRSSRAIDVADLSRMLGLADDEALAEVRDKVQEFAPADAEDLEAIIELGKLEADGT